jgi:hypothetical protein
LLGALKEHIWLTVFDVRFWLFVGLMKGRHGAILLKKSDFQIGEKLNDESSVLVRFHVEPDPTCRISIAGAYFLVVRKF